MLAANQRPILALGTVLLLVGLAGCTAADRNGASYPRPTDQTAAILHSRQAAGQLPAGQGSRNPAGDATSESEFSSSHPRVQSFVGQYQTSLRAYMQQALLRASK